MIVDVERVGDSVLLTIRAGKTISVFIDDPHDAYRLGKALMETATDTTSVLDRLDEGGL